jgi:hypothetical protein
MTLFRPQTAYAGCCKKKKKEIAPISPNFLLGAPNAAQVLAPARKRRRGGASVVDNEPRCGTVHAPRSLARAPRGQLFVTFVSRSDLFPLRPYGRRYHFPSNVFVPLILRPHHILWPFIIPLITQLSSPPFPVV